MVRLIKNIILYFLVAVLFSASGGVNIYYHFCHNGHNYGIYSFTELECHCHIDGHHCSHGKEFCNIENNEDSYYEDDCCTNHHEFINLIADFDLEQEFNVPSPVFLDIDKILHEAIKISLLEDFSSQEIHYPPDIQIRETGRDLICLIQTFRIGDCHIA